MEIVKLAHEVIKSKKIEEKNKSDEKLNINNLEMLVMLTIWFFGFIKIPNIYMFIEKLYGIIFAGFISITISTAYFIILFLMFHIMKKKNHQNQKN